MKATTSTTLLGLTLLLAACAGTSNTSISDAPSSASLSSSSDSRTVLTQPNLFAIRDVLTERAQKARPNESYLTLDAEAEDEFDLSKQAKPSMVKPYESIFFGISFDVPYNPQWLNDVYALPPVYEDQLNGEVSFGPLIYDWHGNAFYRAGSMRIVTARTAEAALQSAESSEYLVEGAKPVMKTIAGTTVVSYSEEPPESATVNMVEIMGPTSNYLLSSTEMSLAELEKMVESVKFTARAQTSASSL
jgi:hypothetical protein